MSRLFIRLFFFKIKFLWEANVFFYKKNVLQASWVFLAILLEEPQSLPRWLEEPEDFLTKEDHMKQAGTGKIYVSGGHTLVVRKQQVIPSDLRHEPVFNPGCQL